MDRTYITLNENWKFHYGEVPEGWYKGYDDSAWTSVTLPHDWSVHMPFEQTNSSGTGYLSGGIGWYRVRFSLPEAYKGKRVRVVFDGIYKNSRIWCNSYHIGKRPYGYTQISYDITDFVQFGAIDNEITVRVCHTDLADSRWFTGSGIYRKAYLVVEEQVHAVWNGVAFNVSRADEQSAAVCADAEIVNELDERVIGTLTASLKLCGSDEESVVFARVPAAMEAHEKKTFYLNGMIGKPKLWSCESPSLYELCISFEKEDENVIVLDKERVGIRTFSFDADQGFFLNGKETKFKGVCVHHDGGCLGAAMYREVWLRRLLKLKEGGCNAIRCSHNPHMPELYDLCDELGFYVMDEAFDEWRLMKAKEIGSNTHESHGYSMYFDACHEWDLKTMLYRDRNHPGIVLWSIGNEIPEEVVVGGEELAVELSGYCHTIDPTRKVTLAHDQIAAEPYSARDAFMDKIDVVGYNYVGRWRERAELLYDADREEHLDRCVIGTENPSAGYIRSDYNFEVDPGSFWNKPYYTAAVTVGKLLRYTMVHDFVAGDYMWTGIDYLGEANWPQRSAGCGCLDTCGFEKDAFYFYKSVWNQKEKFAYLCPHWNLKLEKGTVLPVICYTNCEDAELFVNGRSFGMKSKGFPCYGMTERYGHFDRYRRPANTDDLFLSWDVPYEPGKIEVVGYHDGKEVCRYNVETTGEAAAIKLTVDKTSVDADGRSIVQAEVRIVDNEGRLVFDACPELDFTLEGDAEIIGIDNGDPACHEQWKETKGRHAFNGMAYAVIRAGQNKGELTLTVQASGVDAAIGKASVTISQK